MTAGKLTKEQADAIKQRIEDGTQPIFGGPGFGGPRGHFGGPGFGGPGGPRAFGFGFGFGPGLMAGADDVATYLGLKPAELATQLRSGKSLADIAKAQGKTVEGLKTAITDAATKQLDAAVTAGKLTKEQETKLLAGLASHLDDFVNGVHKGVRGFRVPGGPGGMRHGFGFGFGPGLMAGAEDVATYLGLKPAELATQLRSGKSLADIAKAQGKTVEGLKTAITDAATKQLDAAVTAGKLTKEQETKLLAGLASHLDDLVNGVHEGFGFRHGHDGDARTARTALGPGRRHSAAPGARRHGPGAGHGLISPPPHDRGPTPIVRAAPQPSCAAQSRAQPDDREVAEAGIEARRLAHRPPHAVQLLRCDRALCAAALADEVLPLAPGAHVAAGAVPEVDVLHEPEALERLEIAVDRGEVRGRQLADAVGDLLGAERGVGRVQRLEHHPARTRQPEAARAQGRDRLLQRLGLDARTRVRGRHLTARVVDRAAGGSIGRVYDRAR